MGRCKGFSVCLQLQRTTGRLGWNRWPAKWESGSLEGDLKGAGHAKETSSTAPNQNKQRRSRRGVIFGQSGIVKIHLTLHEISVNLDMRITTVLRIRFYLSRAWKHVLRFSLKRFSTHCA